MPTTNLLTLDDADASTGSSVGQPHRRHPLLLPAVALGLAFIAKTRLRSEDVRCRSYWRKKLTLTGYNRCSRISFVDASSAFEELVSRWRDDTAVLSDLDLKFGHPIYRRIVSFGYRIVPHVYAQFERDPFNWIYALESIVGARRVYKTKPESLDDAIAAWRNWYRGSDRGMNGTDVP